MKPLIPAILLAGALAASFPSHAQVLRWASQGDPQTMDPHSQNELLTNSINAQVYETLVKRDKNLQLVPGLATSWTQLAPKKWRMALRRGVKFHDGADFTADDVVFSVKRAQHSASAIQAYASALGEPKRIDDHTVEFELAQVNPIFLQHASLVFIMNRGWAERNNAAVPLDFKNKEVKYTALNANGTGPYMLVSRQPDAKTVFRRNPKYRESLEGNVQEVVYTPIKNDSTRTAALLSGELDLVLDPVPQDMERLRANPAIKVLDGAENRAIFIGMDQARDELLNSNIKGRNPFKDVRVRRALYHAVNIEALQTNLMRGMALPTGSILPSTLGTYNDPEFEKRLPYDPDKAKALLAQAGYPEGFEVTMDCPNNRYINDEKVCIALAAMWGRVGVRVKVNSMPRAVYFPKMEKLDTSMYMLGWGGAITDAETTLTPIMRSRGEQGVGYWNWGNYRNPRLDELASASSQEADPARRAELVKGAVREHNEQIHHIPLYRQVIPWAMRRNVDAVHRADNWLEWRWVTVR